MQHQPFASPAAGGAARRIEQVYAGQVSLVLSVASVEGYYEEIERVRHMDKRRNCTHCMYYARKKLYW